MPIIYPTIDQAIDVHRKTVEVSGGGVLGHLDMGRLESVLDHIQNDDYYPTFEEKLSHLFHSACKFHCFQDGNKRIAISLGAQFLIVNGYIFVAGKFIREMENIASISFVAPLAVFQRIEVVETVHADVIIALG